jgi:hypothetical protein
MGCFGNVEAAMAGGFLSMIRGRALDIVSADFVLVKIHRSKRRRSARNGALVEPSRLRAPVLLM